MQHVNSLQVFGHEEVREDLREVQVQHLLSGPGSRRGSGGAIISIHTLIPLLIPQHTLVVIVSLTLLLCEDATR